MTAVRVFQWEWPGAWRDGNSIFSAPDPEAKASFEMDEVPLKTASGLALRSASEAGEGASVYPSRGSRHQGLRRLPCAALILPVLLGTGDVTVGAARGRRPIYP